MGPGLAYLSLPNKHKETQLGKNSLYEFVTMEMQGWRRSMEDAHVAILNYGGDPSAALFGFFDGHGGNLYSIIGCEVAKFAAHHLPEDLLNDPNYGAGNYEKALKAAFLKIDQRLNQESGKNEISKLEAESNLADMASPTRQMIPDSVGEGPDMKGCTANVVLIKNEILYVANAGDSRSVLSKGSETIELSFDHKPDMPSEKSRITKAGGTVEDGRVEGNLNLSRGLGDLHYKANKSLKPEEQMISADPDIKKMPILPDFDFIVMGCDGIYESKSSEEMGQFFRKELTATGGKIKECMEKLLDISCSPDYVKTEGLGCDNMTCIFIRFIKE